VSDAPNSPQDTPTQKTGCLGGPAVGCLAFIGVLAVIAIVGLVILSMNAVSIATSMAVSAVEQSDLPKTEKEDLIRMTKRLDQEYEAGKISDQQMSRIFERIEKSPVTEVSRVYALTELWLEPSGLSQDEKRQARRTLNRLAHALHDGSVNREDFKQALQPLDQEGFFGQGFQPKRDPSDEQLREALGNLRQRLDEAGVPKDPEPYSLSAQLAKAINQALKIEPGSDRAYRAKDPEPLLEAEPEDTTGEAATSDGG
jgi:hypothetical protein